MFREVSGILVGVSAVSFNIALTKPPFLNESSEESGLGESSVRP